MPSEYHSLHKARATVTVDPRARDPLHHIGFALIQSAQSYNVEALEDLFPICARSARSELLVEPVDGPVLLPSGESWTLARLTIEEEGGLLKGLLPSRHETYRVPLSTAKKEKYKYAGLDIDNGHSLRFIGGWPHRWRDEIGYYRENDNDEMWQDDVSLTQSHFFVPQTSVATNDAPKAGLEPELADWETVSVAHTDAAVGLVLEASDMGLYKVYGQCINPMIQISQEVSKLIRESREHGEQRWETAQEAPTLEVTIDWSNCKGGKDFSTKRQTVKVRQVADVVHLDSWDQATQYTYLFAKQVPGSRTDKKMTSAGPVITQDVEFIWSERARVNEATADDSWP